MSSIIVSTRTISDQGTESDSLLQIISRALADFGYPQPHRVKLHEVLSTFTNQAPEYDVKQIAQDLAMQYRDVQSLHENVEIVAMKLFPDKEA